MSREGLRVTGLAIASIAAILAATLVFAWFIVDLNGADVTDIMIDLREARACTKLGPCGVVPLSMIKGAYPTLAAVSFWSSLLFAALVAYNAGARMMSGGAPDSIRKAGHAVGFLALLTSLAAGFVFGPNLTPGSMMGVGFDIDRSWGPLAMLAGILLGHAALHVSRMPSLDDTPAYKPVELPQATARQNKVMLPLETPAAGLPRVKTPTSQPRTHAPTTPPPKSTAMPEGFKGKVKFSMVAGEITVAGIDGRREDGTSVLVMWRDVVGFVVRRLPAELEGHPFVDVVSTAGMTLRIVPWSKLSGELIAGDTSEARVRAFVKLVKPRCPDAKLDRATQTFVDDDTKTPAQLPSLEMLAKHDQALA